MRRNRTLIFWAIRFGLALFALAPWTDALYAQPKSSPLERYPGPWLDVTQEVRDLLAFHKISACSEAVERQSARNSNEYLLYCTQDERHWTSWRVELATRKLHGPGKLFEGIAVPTSY